MKTPTKKTATATPKSKPAPTPVVEVVDLEGLKPWDDNPKKHNARQINEYAKSIARFGFNGVLVVQKKSRRIYKGHGARLALLKHFEKTKAAKPWRVTVMFTDLPDHECEAFALADNGIAAMTGNDDRRLGAALEKLRARSTAALEGLGFGARKIDKLIAKASVDVGSGEEVDASQPLKVKTREGDVLELGPHRVLCGDAFDVDARARLFALDLAALGSAPLQCALVVTDPPYAIYGSSTGIGEDIADDAMVEPFFAKVFEIALERVKIFGHVYAFCDWRSFPALHKGARLSKMAPKSLLVWDKGGGGLGSSYANVYELIAFYARLPPSRSMQNQTTTGQRMVHAPNLVRFNRVSGDEREHNAQKPIGLVEMLITNSSDEGEIVYDPFLGSGTTLIAAEKLRRICRGSEKDPATCDKIARRWERMTGGKARWIPKPSAS